MAPSKTPHIVIVPFMSQGHILPLLDISKALSCRGLKVTIITTPSNATSIRPRIAKYSNIHLTEIPFPTIDGLRESCENTAQLPSLDFLVPFLCATIELQRPFEHVLTEMIENGSQPICVISDFFLAWTIATCRKFDIPRLVFHGMGVLAMVVSKSVAKHKLHRLIQSDTEPLRLPETQLLFTLTKSDMPEHFRFLDDDSALSKYIADSAEIDEESWGVVVNSFAEMEGCHLPVLEQFYKNGAKAWCVGPALLYDDEIDSTLNRSPSTTISLDWLEDQISNPASVIYVSFGTQAHLHDADLDEIGLGLEMSAHHFFWVMKSKTWSPPAGLEERVKSRGLIVREWVDQRRILAHCSVGGFLSHCGWNSVLESLSMGVPLLALPMNAEQPVNAKQVVDELEAGIRVEMGGPSGWQMMSINRQAICDGVKELMGNEKGRKVRKKAEEFGRAARQAVKEGGSSYKGLTDLIGTLRARQTGISD